MLLLEGPIIPYNGRAASPPLQFTLYLPLPGVVYFGQIFCFKNPSKNQTNEIIVQNYSNCLISISLLYNLICRFPTSLVPPCEQISSKGRLPPNGRGIILKPRIPPLVLFTMFAKHFTQTFDIFE